MAAGRRFRWLRRWWWAVYLALLGASYLVRGLGGEPNLLVPQGVEQVLITATNDDGPIAGRTMSIGVRRWSAAGEPEAKGLPVILLHGSPGQSWDFSRVGPLLATGGHDALAIDLPGFGASDHRVPRYSILAYAHAVREIMDATGVQRAHIVGWSNGGGAALHVADLFPERIASLTLMASIGDQSVEGSGDFYFEHFKYAIGYAGLVVLPKAIPHFGVFPEWMAHSFMRNFWDSDQRPLRAIMQRLAIPTLILHGRSDFLTPARAAELHHELIPGSRLVMLDASHFLPFLQPDLASQHLLTFFGDVQAGRPVAGTFDLAPRATRTGFAAFLDRLLLRFQALDWWWECLFAALGFFFTRRLGLAVLAWLIAAVILDIAVASIGVAVAAAAITVRTWRTSPRKSRFGLLRALCVRPLRAVIGLIALRLFAGLTGIPSWFDALGGPGFFAGVAVLYLVAFIIPRIFTWEGRQRLKASLTKVVRHEWWPSKVFYTPLMPWLAWLSIRHRHPLVFTAVNPGIEAGGGIVGESKHQILKAMPDEAVLPAAFIDASGSPRDRARRALEALETRPELGGLPAILKPDSAQRGFAVKLARREQDIHDYFESMTRPAVLQKYHAGPGEVGIFWIRDPNVDPGANGEMLAGRIFAITRKEFSSIEGDGVTPLRRLILAHPRYRCQADVFFERFRARLDDILVRGERLRLAEAGNHAQGTLFRDGSDLITPALEGRIDAIARSFRGIDGGHFDFGRFDVRYATEDDLRAGRGLGIVELNGTMSEATNLYDPSRSVLWSYSILFRQWSHLYRLGAWRREQGCRPLGPLELRRIIKDYYRDRPGSAVAD